MLNRVTAVGFGLGLVASACGSPSSPERPEGLDPRFVSAVGAEGYFDYAAQPCSIVPRDFPRSSSDEMPAPIWTVGTVEHEPIDYGDVIDFGTEDGVQRVEEIAGEVYEQVGPMLTEDYQQDVDPAVKITILGESCKDPKIDEDEGYEMQFNAFAIPPDDTQAGGIEIQAYENNVAPAAVVWMVLAHEWGHHVLYDYFNFDQENPEFNRYVSDEGYADGFFEATYYSIIGSRLPDLQPEIDAIRHDESLSPTQKYGMVAELVSKAVRSFPN